MPYALKMLEG